MLVLVTIIIELLLVASIIKLVLVNIIDRFGLKEF